jgi:hypothetical protein
MSRTLELTIDDPYAAMLDEIDDGTALSDIEQEIETMIHRSYQQRQQQ